jgi:RNA polymerase sigma-70 factor (ECF subfamily)
VTAPDDQLVAAFLRDRSEEAFAALYARHAPIVYGLALRLAGASAADDVAQDAWMRAVARLADFRGQSALRTWLCGFVVNCCRERWRAAGRDLAVEPEPVVRPDPADALDVDAALARLPDGYRAALVLHDVYGHTHAEIAAMLGIEEGTSKSQLSRGRRAMRALMEGKGRRDDA